MEPQLFFLAEHCGSRYGSTVNRDSKHDWSTMRAEMRALWSRDGRFWEGQRAELLWPHEHSLGHLSSQRGGVPGHPRSSQALPLFSASLDTPKS